MEHSLTDLPQKFYISHNYVVYGNMPNITLSLPEPLYTRMREFSWVKWSEVARAAFEAKLEELHRLPRQHVIRGMPVMAGRIKNKRLEWIPYPEDEAPVARDDEV